MSNRVLATNITSYAELVVALRARVEQRRIPLNSEELHAVCGLPDRYLPKVLGPKGASEGGKHLGMMSLGPVLAVLGCKLQLVEDPDAIAQYGARIPVSNIARSRACVQVHSRKKLRENGRLGGIASGKIRAEQAKQRAKWRAQKQTQAQRRKRERDRLRQTEGSLNA